VANDGISWLILGTNGDHPIQANGKPEEEDCRQAQETGLVQPT
jgi:hypothetical protein